MRPYLLVRLGLVLSGALALGILDARAVEAAPRTRHAQIARSQGDHGMRHRVRAAAQRSSRRSTYYLLRAQRLVRWHIPERLERRQTAPLRESDAAALQTSVAAVSGEDDLLVLASLELLGILSLPPCLIPIKGAVTPRSPRGPPSFRA